MLDGVLFGLVVLGVFQVLSVAALWSGEAIILVWEIGRGGRFGSAGNWGEPGMRVSGGEHVDWDVLVFDHVHVFVFSEEIMELLLVILVGGSIWLRMEG